MEPEVEGATETPLQGASRAMDRQVPRETSLTHLPITGYLAPPASPVQDDRPTMENLVASPRDRPTLQNGVDGLMNPHH